MPEAAHQWRSRRNVTSSDAGSARTFLAIHSAAARSRFFVSFDDGEGGVDVGDVVGVGDAAEVEVDGVQLGAQTQSTDQRVPGSAEVGEGIRRIWNAGDELANA